MPDRSLDIAVKLAFALFSVVASLFGYLWTRQDKLESLTQSQALETSARLARIETKLDRILIVRR